ncbi:rhodanese-like domain-containing protein [Spiroplasma culicicola]|uniref:Rhodanese domain-containing protein n=1 Tax=Spiroplasma culicicola AES-1 TaxID=1276246 RepID=W6A6E8_9MOLU|nr:rhodanese-like domain-containing protein [Spiroplasma culicicola]AHI52425.1 hypothetical protein SCULI_v1c00840 [Spiroplasma culicicola AES-1]
MQWLDYVLKFIERIFKTNSFKRKYKTKSEKKFLKILKSKNWQVVDLRNNVSYQEKHIIDSINVPVVGFNYNYYRKIDKNKKILLVNKNYRSNLDIYNTLKVKGFKVYILYTNFDQLCQNPQVDNHTRLFIYK